MGLLANVTDLILIMLIKESQPRLRRVCNEFMGVCDSKVTLYASLRVDYQIWSTSTQKGKNFRRAAN